MANRGRPWPVARIH